MIAAEIRAHTGSMVGRCSRRTSEPSLSRAISWQGTREVTLTQEGITIHPDYQGKADFAVTPAGLIYSGAGKVLRAYHRLPRE